MNLPIRLISILMIAVWISTGFSQKKKEMSKEIKVGDQVPEFVLKDQNGEDFSISELIGKKSMVIYFYPKDETKVCTVEACSFRDSYEVFQDMNCEVIGISNDGESSHKSFAENHKLPFVLLSDEKNRVRNLFNVPKDMFGLMPGRYTYVIDTTGRVIHVFNSAFNGEKHVKESLAALKKAQ